MSEQLMRVTAISLRRRPDRWSACEAHMRAILPEDLLDRFDILEGTE